MASILDEYEDSLHRSAAVQQSRAAVGIPHSGKRLSAARTDGRAPVRCPGAAVWHVRRRGASGRGVSLKGRAPRGAVWWVSVRRRASGLSALQHGSVGAGGAVRGHLNSFLFFDF